MIQVEGYYGVHSPTCFSSCFFFSFPDPVFYFGNTDYHVDESDGYVEVQVWRTGTDLSKGGTVTVRSRKTDPVSAEGICWSPSPTALSSLFLDKCKFTENKRFQMSH